MHGDKPWLAPGHSKCARRPLSGVRISGDHRRKAVSLPEGITSYDDSRWRLELDTRNAQGARLAAYA